MIPQIGLGSWELGGRVLATAVDASVVAGHRHHGIAFFADAPVGNGRRLQDPVIAALAVPDGRIFDPAWVAAWVWDGDRPGGQPSAWLINA